MQELLCYTSTVGHMTYAAKIMASLAGHVSLFLGRQVQQSVKMSTLVK